MKLLLAILLAVTLTGCASHDNPLGGQVTTVTPSSVDKHMVVVEAEIKRIVQGQGIKDAVLYWVINDAKQKGNMAVFDVSITVQGLRQRFLFGMTDGKIDMVKEIEVEAEVDCQHEGEMYEGRQQA